MLLQVFDLSAGIASCPASNCGAPGFQGIYLEK